MACICFNYNARAKESTILSHNALYNLGSQYNRVDQLNLGQTAGLHLHR